MVRAKYYKDIGRASITVLLIFPVIFVQIAQAQKNIAINPSNQTGNPVCGGGTEADYALIMANQAKDKLTALGYNVKVFTGDISGIPSQVNSWNLQSGGAHAFVSMHTNATATGGCAGTARGTTTYYHPNYKTTDVILAGKVQSGLVNCLEIKDNGFTAHWLDLAVLRGVIAPNCLEEALFHDNQFDADILRSAAGQDKISNGVSNGIDRYFGGSGNPCGGVPPPSNDEPCGADTLTVQTTCNYSDWTIVKASKSAQVPDASCDQPSNVDVWFKFSIPAGTFGIHTNSISISGNDCGLAIYTGSCSSLTERTCIIGGNPAQKYMPWNDNVNLSAYAGQTGYIRVWEFGSVSQTGDFQICLIGTGNTACKISSIEPAKLILGPDGFSSTPGKDNIAINAQPACTYAVAENCDWLTVTPMNGLTTTAGQAFINYSIQANTSVSTRSCTVTFNGSPLTITQNGCTVPEPASGITVVSGTDPGCTGQNVTYRVPEITGATSYLWMLPDGTATSTVTNTLSFSYTNPVNGGILKVKGNNNCGNGAESSIKVTVNHTPPMPAINLINGVLYSTGISGNQWYYENNPIQNALNQTYTPSSGGRYHVVVTANNCPSQPSNIISVITEVNAIPQEKEILVYPNPTTGIIEILFDKPMKSEYTVELFNEAGETVEKIRRNNRESHLRIDISPNPPGLYLIRISGRDVIYSKKIIKTKH